MGLGEGGGGLKGRVLLKLSLSRRSPESKLVLLKLSLSRRSPESKLVLLKLSLSRRSPESKLERALTYRSRS
jgi:hypothetical protein